MSNEIKLKPGKYEVEAKGHNSALPMTVELSETRIEKIEVDSSKESEGISSPVFERIPEAIVKGQTLNIDAISGATVSTDGILEGVAKAIEEAGGNPEIFQSRPKYTEETSDELVEIEKDVVVIGSGGAGLSAAAVALEKNLDVIILEKGPSLGGNTIRTGGPINAANPEWQSNFDAIPGERETLEKIYNLDDVDIHEEYREDFYNLRMQLDDYFKDLDDGADYTFDSIELHRIQTYLGGKRTDREGNEIYSDYDLNRQMTDHVLESIKWLEEKGVDFNKAEIRMPVGANWRRGHSPKQQQGYAYIENLENFIRENNGDILMDTKVTELIKENGRVVGVKATHTSGKQYVIKANKGVVLATGGFGANTPMIQEYNNYWSDIPDDIKTTNSPIITGDGIELGTAVDADLTGMEFVQLMPTADPKTGALFTGFILPPEDFVFVNPEGKRFVNEYESRDVLSQAALDEGGTFYIISDTEMNKAAFNTSEEKVNQEVEEGTIFKADTLEELAKQIDINPERLVETITQYNKYVEQGRDEDFNKGAMNHKVEAGPFYATPRKPSVHHTMGGLAINANTEVLDKNGEVIQGLFAAGEVAGGMHAGNRLGGNSLSDIFTMGRIAGQTVSNA